jgi:uncharacterized membrane protein YgcG
MSGGSLPHCFDGFPPRVLAYAEGEWVDRPASVPHYHINRGFWPTIGSKVHSTLPQHYGRCDEVKPERRLYAWKPKECALLPFERDEACKLLTGLQIVIVGDSTVFQTFLSLVHLLGGSFGRDVKHGYVTADLTASACADTTRLVYVRSDLLLWTHSVSDYHAVQRCDGFTILHPFVQRASRDADIVLLGVGHHFPRSLMLAEKWSYMGGEEAARRARIGFFSRNLNHTLSSLLWRRAAWGRKDPASVVLMGASTPVRGCERFHAPLAASDAISVAAGGQSANGEAQSNVTANELRWTQYARYNEIARSLAATYDASFIDVAAPSALRADGAMGGYWPAGDARQRDCVHYCLPGVVDMWPTLLYNLLTSTRLRKALDEHRRGPAAGATGVTGQQQQRASSASGGGGGGASSGGGSSGGGSTSDAAVARGRPRFLNTNVSEWLHQKGFAERFEACGRTRRGMCEYNLQRQPWWAFRCVEPRERALVRGPRYNVEYVPWMPAESFD